MGTNPTPSTKPRCGRKTRSGAPCTQFPVEGTTVCRMHGGTAPQVRAAAARNVVAAKIEGAVKSGKLDLSSAAPVGDPLRELQALAGRAVLWEELIREKVDLERLRYASEIGTEQIRGEIQIWMQAMRQVESLLGLIAKLKIDERLIAIEEGKAQMIMRAISAALRSAGVTGPAEAAALKVAGRELRLIQGGKAAGY